MFGNERETETDGWNSWFKKYIGNLNEAGFEDIFTAVSSILKQVSVFKLEEN